MIALLKALGDETRFRILELLLTHDLCVGALAKRVGLSEAAVSQHLQVLRRAGLVRGEKRGYWTHYIVNREALRGLAQRLESLADRRPAEASACFRTILQQEEISEERRIPQMCCTDCCQHPEKLKGKPEECTPEQIKECHGEVKEHPCESEKKD
jgi:DNA-binding transcriptional ArsR family regulator